MCDFSAKLIAWMDRELPESEAAEMKSHVAACGECRERLAACQQASSAFDAYCEAFVAAETRRPRTPRWAIAACTAGAIAAAAAIAALLVLPRSRVAQAPALASALASARATALRAAVQKPVQEPTQKPVQKPLQKNDAPRAAVRAPLAAATEIRHRSVADTAQTENARNETAAAKPRPAAASAAGAFPAEPPIEISIPADAMFPPGAVPPGVSFTADLTIAADGSAERLGLRPRLAGFERRANQP